MHNLPALSRASWPFGCMGHFRVQLTNGTAPSWPLGNIEGAGNVFGWSSVRPFLFPDPIKRVCACFRFPWPASYLLVVCCYRSHDTASCRPAPLFGTIFCELRKALFQCTGLFLKRNKKILIHERLMEKWKRSNVRIGFPSLIERGSLFYFWIWSPYFEIDWRLLSFTTVIG